MVPPNPPAVFILQEKYDEVRSHWIQTGIENQAFANDYFQPIIIPVISACLSIQENIAPQYTGEQIANAWENKTDSSPSIAPELLDKINTVCQKINLNPSHLKAKENFKAFILQIQKDTALFNTSLNRMRHYEQIQAAIATAIYSQAAFIRAWKGYHQQEPISPEEHLWIKYVRLAIDTNNFKDMSVPEQVEIFEPRLISFELKKQEYGKETP